VAIIGILVSRGCAAARVTCRLPNRVGTLQLRISAEIAEHLALLNVVPTRTGFIVALQFGHGSGAPPSSTAGADLTPH